MRCTIPEISWHNRDPVLSIDIQSQQANEDFHRLASGGTDAHVIIWHVRTSEDGVTAIDAAADLVRHQKAVNVVRFSPCGKFLASGDDESVIMIWKQRQDTDAPDLNAPGDSEVVSRESWIVLKILRGHLEDVYDLCWSPDSLSIISGSVDNTAILWDVQKGSKVILGDHKGFVQGVAWDPKGQYVASLSSDRKMHIYNISSKKLAARVGKAPLPVPKGHDLEGKNINLFHDDTIQTFFRRLCFSPDGEMIIAPSGVIEATEPGKKPSSTTLVFSRRLLNRPVCYLPSLDEYSVCVRCCPVLFELRNLDPSTKPESMFLLPYRIVFAVATSCAVVLYDTQQPMPFGYISNLHYTRLTDLAWSPDGGMLIVSSTDGYCSIITFSPGELGVVYDTKSSGAPQVSPKETRSSSDESASVQALEINSEVDMEKEVSNSSNGMACMQLSPDNSADGSDLGLSKLQDEEGEVRSEACDTAHPQNNETSMGEDNCNLELPMKQCQSDCPESETTKIVVKSDAKVEKNEEKDIEKCFKPLSNSVDKNLEIGDEATSVEELSSESQSKSETSDEGSSNLKEAVIEAGKDSEKPCPSQPANEVVTPKAAINGELFSESPNKSETSDLIFSNVNKAVSEEEKDSQNPCHSQTVDKVVTPSNSGKKARRVQLITLSSPKSRKKLL